MLTIKHMQHTLPFTAQERVPTRDLPVSVGSMVTWMRGEQLLWNMIGIGVAEIVSRWGSAMYDMAIGYSYYLH